MKRSYFTLFLLAILATSMIRSCQDKTFRTFTANVPVYMSYEDLRKSVSVSESHELSQPGAIYFKDNYMYINEYREGIHVIDLQDPENPVEVSYITVPGNTSVAIKGDILYADSYVDLVLIDVSDPENPVESDRIEDIFEYTVPEYDESYPVDEVDEELGVVASWEIKEIKREVISYYYPWPMYDGYIALSSSVNSSSSYVSGAGSSEYGIAGSMATFLTYDKYLYLIEDMSMIKTININDPDNISIASKQYISWNLETMFIADGYMYIGTTTGMHILSLSSPASPSYVSSYSHATSCDPVVVSGNYAYVTLRSGNTCGGILNELDVINISNKSNPNLIAVYDMTSPYGLAVDGSTLFICEGEHGMKVYDITDKYAIDDNMLVSLPDYDSKDIIVVGDLMFLIGDDGFHIYDKTDVNTISLLGTIPIVTVEE